MKRVDWRPQRRAQPAEPRQEQVRAHLLGRGARHHRQRDEPHQGEVRPDRHPLPVRPARREQGRARPATAPAASCCALLGGFTLQIRKPDSWEGWCWGTKHVWGCEPVGQRPAEQPAQGHRQERELLLFWGCDQETTPWGWQGQLASRLSYWWTEIGIKQIYICPDLNYAAAVHADKWIPVLPNTDAALYLAITYLWFKEGTYDKEYVDDPRRRRGQVRSLRHGRGGRRPQDPGVGRSHHAASPPASSRRWPRVGLQAHHRRHRQRRPRHPRPLLHRAGPPAGASAWPCRAWASRACNQAKMIEWGLLRRPRAVRASPSRSRVPNLRTAYTRRPPVRDLNHPSFIPKTFIPKAILEGESTGGAASPRPPTARGPVHPLQVPGRRLLQDPHDLDRLAVLDHLLEPRQRLRRGHAHPDIEFMFAQHPWLENDCLLRRHHPAGEHQAGRGRHRRRHLQRPVPTCSSPSTSASSRSASPTATTRSCASSPRSWACWRSTPGGKTHPRAHQVRLRDLARAPTSSAGKSSTRRATASSRPPTDWEDDPAGLLAASTRTRRSTRSPPPPASSSSTPPAWPSTSPTTSSGRRCRSGSRRASRHDETIGTERAKKYPLLVMSNHPRWSVHSQHDDITWLREIATCKVTGSRRLPVRAGLAAPGRRRGARHQGRRHRQHLQRARHRARRRLRDGAHHARRDLHRPRRQVRPHRSRARSTAAAPSTPSSRATSPPRTPCGQAISGFLVDVREDRAWKTCKAKYPEAFARSVRPLCRSWLRRLGPEGGE